MPVFLVSFTAGGSICFLNPGVRVAMHDAPQVKQMQDLATDIAKTASMAGVEGNGADGASSNLKFHASRAFS